MENNTKAHFTTAIGVAGEDDPLSGCFFSLNGGQGGLNPRHEDSQWRFAKFPEHFQLVAKIKSRGAAECATALFKFQKLMPL